MTVDVGAPTDELVHEVRPDEAESAGDDAPRAGERERVATRAAYDRALYGGADRACRHRATSGHGSQECATTAWAKYPRPIAEQARAAQITQLGGRRDSESATAICIGNASTA